MRKTTRSYRSRLTVLILTAAVLATSTGCKADPKAIMATISGVLAGVAATSQASASTTSPTGSIGTRVPGASTGSLIPGITTSFGPSTKATPGTNTSNGGLPGLDTSRATPTNGTSFFKSLPLPEGSWTVSPNGHFWDCRNSCKRPHHGNDLVATPGTPVFAVADGVVQRVKYNKGGYQWYIIIRHEAQSTQGVNYNTLYGHITVAPGLKAGDRVTAGQQIASVAPKIKPPHCHFEVLLNNGGWKGTPLNPNAFANFHPKGARAKVAYTGSPPMGRGLV